MQDRVTSSGAFPDAEDGSVVFFCLLRQSAYKYKRIFLEVFFMPNAIVKGGIVAWMMSSSLSAQVVDEVTLACVNLLSVKLSEGSTTWECLSEGHLYACRDETIFSFPQMYEFDVRELDIVGHETVSNSLIVECYAEACIGVFDPNPVEQLNGNEVFSKYQGKTGRLTVGLRGTLSGYEKRTLAACENRYFQLQKLLGN